VSSPSVLALPTAGALCAPRGQPWTSPPRSPVPPRREFVVRLGPPRRRGPVLPRCETGRSTPRSSAPPRRELAVSRLAVRLGPPR
jgi:hypothetical protein